MNDNDSDVPAMSVTRHCFCRMPTKATADKVHDLTDDVDDADGHRRD